MCIIIIKNNKKLIKTETLLTSAIKNPDGLGILWLDTWKVTYHDSKDYMELKTQRPYIAHFRYATVGKVCRANCHPFHIDDDNILFQNGTVHGLGNKKKTDTQHMAEILSDLPRKRWRSVLEMNDSRFVTANLKKKSFTIYNKEDWITRNKIMYSKDNVLDMTLIGVYGTLKKGYSNYHAHLRTETYVGSGETVDKYPMVVKGIPYLLNRVGDGHNVDIDLFLVDKDAMMDIDMLEGHPHWYQRKRIEVITNKGNVFMPYVYFNDNHDNGEYHKTYTEDVWDYNGYDGYNDYISDECTCANPEPIMDYGDCYCDVCYGTIDKHQQINSITKYM
tara:strand:- start:190 stop:1188 length:999 start_codon:yes stop_codon:yes gene_type:complete